MDKKTQRLSFRLTLAVNGTWAFVNIVLAIWDLTTGYRVGAQVSGTVAAVASAIVWFIVTMNAQLAVKQETMESYRDEQLVDTVMKQEMLKRVQSGELHIGMGVPIGPVGRAH
jgi:hypothetical protein